MEQPVFLIVLVIILPVGASVDMCMDGSKPCPRDRPYCTEVGCVYQCPDQYLINGTTCVWSCGDAITDLSNKSCISTCPTPGMLIFEEVVRIGNQLRKQKVCLDDCNKYFIDKYGAVAYQFGNTCVKACPDEAIFLWDYKCVPECPTILTIRLNITDPMSNVLIGVECRSACYFIDRMTTDWKHVATPVIENNFCVERCSGKRLILENGTCVDECPASQNLTVDVLLNSDKYESMCIGECLDSEFIDDGVCVNRPSYSGWGFTWTVFLVSSLTNVLLFIIMDRDVVVIAMLTTRCGWWLITCKIKYNLDKYEETGMKRTSHRRHEGTDPVEDTTDLEDLDERTTLELDSLLSSVPTVVNVRNHLDMAAFNVPEEIQIDIHDDTSALRRLHSDEAHRQLSESEPNGSEQEETRVKELACDFIVECLAEAQDAPQLHLNDTSF